MSLSMSITSSPPGPSAPVQQPLSPLRPHPHPHQDQQTRKRHSISSISPSSSSSSSSPSYRPTSSSPTLSMSPLSTTISLSPTTSSPVNPSSSLHQDESPGIRHRHASRARSNTTDITLASSSLHRSPGSGSGSGSGSTSGSGSSGSGSNSSVKRRASGDAAVPVPVSVSVSGSGQPQQQPQYGTAGPSGNSTVSTSPGRTSTSSSGSRSSSSSRYSPRLGASSKSAPTSPSGRITLTGLTPINQINIPSHLDGMTSPLGSTYKSDQQQQPQQQQHRRAQSYFPYQQDYPQPSGSGPGSGLSGQSVSHSPLVPHNTQGYAVAGELDTHAGQSGATRAHGGSQSQSRPQSQLHGTVNHGVQPILVSSLQQHQRQPQPQQQQNQPIQVHPRSLPSTHPIHNLSSPWTHTRQASNATASSQIPPPSSIAAITGTSGQPHSITGISVNSSESGYPTVAAGSSRPGFHGSTPAHVAPPKAPTATSSSAHARVRRNNTLSRSGEDSGIDSDATVRPKTGTGGAKGSLSQPDLTALRSRRVEGWAGGVMSANHSTGTTNAAPVSASLGSEERKGSSGRMRTKTPPTKPIPIPHTQTKPQSQPQHQSTEAWLPASPNNSRSQPSLSMLRKSPSPRNSSLSIPTMSPINARTPLSSSSDEDGFRPFPPLASHRSFTGLASGFGGMSSEDADDDYESTDSPSSGSITFSPKRTRGSGSLRHRFPFQTDKDGPRDRPRFSPVSSGSGLGLSFGPSSTMSNSPAPVSPKSLAPDEVDENQPLFIRVGIKMERWFQHSSLLPLRLLAIVPSLWGIAVLSRALVTGGVWFDVWPWGVDLSREALERVVAGGGWNEGTWRGVRRGDVLLSIAWAICTAHFCFCLTTGLTHRWRSYYSLPSTLTRLLSLQCLCWPATYLTLWFLGAERILLCWVVIGVTTGWSRTVQMWVTSNVVVPVDYRNRSSASNAYDDGASHDLNEDYDSQAGTPSGFGAGAGAGAGAGDLTPNLRTIHMKGPPEVPEGLGFWETFKWGRKWDWDNVAREVGWKVGALLLITNAWLFWGIEEGKVLRL